jgi:GH43 family beta-xylosidase
MYVLESTSGPLGPYVLKGKLFPSGQDRWAIDGTVAEINGSLYCIWSGWPGIQDGRQDLYCARMSTPWSLDKKVVRISKPEHAWESWIKEGRV